MSCISITIDTIKADGRFCASLMDPSIRLLKLIRSLFLVWKLPSLFRMINTFLAGEALGKVGREEAKELYAICTILHGFINQKAQEFDQKPWIRQIIMSHWMSKMVEEKKVVPIVKTIFRAQ